jgi:hypothetical protein
LKKKISVCPVIFQIEAIEILAINEILLNLVIGDDNRVEQVIFYFKDLPG